MNLASILSLYIATNVLIVATSLALRVLKFSMRGNRGLLSWRSLLKLNTLAILMVSITPIAMTLLPRQPFFQPPAKIWSAPSLRQFAKDIGSDYGLVEQPGYLLVSERRSGNGLTAAGISQAGLVLLSATLFAGLWLLIRDMCLLLKIRKSSHLIRKIAKVQVLVSDSVSVPFSYRTFRHANVVIPLALVATPDRFRIAIQHELQHHRQRDTTVVYLIWLLRLTFVVNPFIHLWARDLSETQEFACDETLVDLKKVDSHAYARCLFEVAQTAQSLKGVPICATGLTFQTEGTLLKRRINMMLFQKKTRPQQVFAWTAAIGLVATITIGAYASTGIVQDRRISMEQAEKLLARTKASATSGRDFPIVMNDRVLRQLNRYLGTPEGREFMRAALTRMETERGPIEKAMKKYGVPRELLAMPLIESGYENLSPSPRGAKAAGLWQFIPRTAQVFGLRVDSIVDERLNVPLETDAAMRLLVANKMRFQDWMLSVSAYNAGDERVQEGIDKTGSRDAWVLIGKGFEGDHDYLAKLHAAILIMNNPDSVL